MPPQTSDNMSEYTKQPLLNPKTMAIAFKSKKQQQKQNTNYNNQTTNKIDKCPSIQCVIVGDGAVGKTSLAVSYSNDTFPSEYVPTAFDNYNVVVQVDGQPIRVQLCDTAGQNEFDPLRNLCYPGTDVFMLCFSVVRPESFESACTRWYKELQHQGAAVVLVGTQSDLYNDPKTLQELRRKGQAPVSPGQARELANRLNAPYIETSALTSVKLKEAFDEAIMAALKIKRKRKRSFWRRLCCIH